jgi:ribonuclease Z
VRHPIHCYFPASGKRFFDRLRFGTIYHDTLNIIEHPIKENGLVEDDGQFKIEAAFLDHGIDNLGWRITEADQRKFHPDRLAQLGVRGPLVTELQQKGELLLNGRNNGRRVTLDEVSWIRKGDSVAIVIDTRYCPEALGLARAAKLLLCEATYLEEERQLAYDHYHLTAKGAAALAKEAGARMLVLTHYSARYLDLRPFLSQAKELFPNTYLAEDLKVFPIPRD